jgi:hypothetical protein
MCPSVLVTWGGYMGAKYDKVEKNGAKGRPREENAALLLF